MSWRSVVRSKHFTYLAVGLAVPLLASLLIVVDNERIAFWFLPSMVFPHTCPSRMVFDINCPACGLTRSIIHLVHGQFAESLAVHRLGWFVFLAIVALVPYRLWCLSGARPRIVSSGRAESFCWVGLLVLLILNRACDWAHVF